jgi:MATE family multidrug resistance protein
VTIFAGLIDETTLAAQSVVYTTYLVFFQIPLGIGMGANARVGNLLGSRCANLARMSSLLTLIIGAVCTGIPSICLYFARNQVGYVFSQDPELIQKAGDALSIASVLVFLDGFPTITMGILRGCGLQNWGAGIMIFFYYVFGLPLGAYFAFGLHMDLVGLYLGICICLVLMSICGLGLVGKMNWQRQVDKCVQRVASARIQCHDPNDV